LWFVAAMAGLVVAACALLMSSAASSFIQLMKEEWRFPLWEKIETAFSLIDLLSFGILFGLGVLCLRYHRDQLGRVFFAVGCMSLGVRLIAKAFKQLRGFWKWLAIPIICGAIALLTVLLLGISDDAQTEWLDSISQKEKESFDKLVADHKAHLAPVAPRHQMGSQTIWGGTLGNLTAEQLAESAKEIATAQLGDLATLWHGSESRTNNIYGDREFAAKTSPEKRLIHAQWMRERNKTNKEYKQKSTKAIIQADNLRNAILSRLSPMRMVPAEDSEGEALFKKLLSGNYNDYRDLAAGAAYLRSIANRLPYFPNN